MRQVDPLLPAGGSRAPRRGRGAAARSMPSGVAVVAASALAGLAVFGYFAVADRTLGTDAQEHFAVFYSLSLILGFGAFLPLEAELARTLGRRRDLTAGLREGAVVAGGIAAVVAVLVLAATAPLLDRFGGSGWLLAATVGVAVVSALQFWVRGALLGRGRPRAFAATLAIDSVLRLVVAGLLVLLVSDLSAATFSLSLLLPLLLAHALFVPVVLRRRPRTAQAGHGAGIEDDAPGARDEGSHPVAMVRRLLPLFAATASAQVLLNAPVLLISTTAAPGQAQVFLYAFTLARVPLFMAVPVQGAVVPPMAAMVADGRTDAVVRILARVAAGLVALAAVGALGFALVGPPVLDALYVNTGSPPRLDLVLMAVGVCAHIGLLLTAQANVAAGHHRGSGIAWVSALLAAALAYLVAGWAGAAPFLRVEVAFALGSVLGWALAMVLLLRHARAGDPRGGDPREDAPAAGPPGAAASPTSPRDDA